MAFNNDVAMAVASNEIARRRAERGNTVVHQRRDTEWPTNLEYYWTCTCGQSSRYGSRDVIEVAESASAHQDTCRGNIGA